MNDADDCNCFLCQFRRSLAEPMPVEEPEALTVPNQDAYDVAMTANLRAQTISLLTDSLVKLDNMNARAQADGVRRALDELLPQAPVTSSGETAPNTEAPTVDEFEGVPDELKHYILALRARGIHCGVYKFNL